MSVIRWSYPRRNIPDGDGLPCRLVPDVGHMHENVGDVDRCSVHEEIECPKSAAKHICNVRQPLRPDRRHFSEQIRFASCNGLLLLCRPCGELRYNVSVVHHVLSSDGVIGHLDIIKVIVLIIMENGIVSINVVCNQHVDFEGSADGRGGGSRLEEIVRFSGWGENL